MADTPPRAAAWLWERTVARSIRTAASIYSAILRQLPWREEPERGRRLDVDRLAVEMLSGVMISNSMVYRRMAPLFVSPMASIMSDTEVRLIMV